jgi:NadR type nicotinamide-nucleotide adenylyltransferase
VTPLRVVLIGPECTGKTRLACDLAALYGVPSAPEHAREYVERHAAALTYADVEPIGRGQQAGEDEAIARAAAEGARLVLLDTDLVSTMIYSRHYYGDCPPWIEAAAVRRLADLYLLHAVDVEWEGDGHQREQPERREELFVRFKLTLELLEARTADVAGDWDERRRRSVEAIDRVLAQGRNA